MAFDKFNYEIFRGDDRDLTIAVKAPGGAAQNITGWTFWVTGKVNLADADAAAVFQRTNAGTATGVVITDAANGLATATIRGVDTSALTAQTTLFVDIQGKDGNGRVATLSTGKITIVLEVTQATA